MKKSWPPLLFWGAAWGICEATFGFFLHLIAVALPGLPGMLLFPVGFFCMRTAQKATGKASAPFLIAMVAAGIKLGDFLMPHPDVIRVVNPALSILMEGLAVTAFFALRGARGGEAGIVQAFYMGVLWRAMFAAWLFLTSLSGLPAALVTSGPAVFLRFLLLESFVNGLVIHAGLRLAPRLPTFGPRPVRPAAALAACLAALGLQAVL